MSDDYSAATTVSELVITGKPPVPTRIDGLQQASWRGVPFAVLAGDGQFGRRVAVHEYPFRDKPWVEDLGRSARKINLVGFLITDSAVYGGGDAIAQTEQMIAAAETSGSGILIHPTLGSLTVSLVAPLAVLARWDNGVRYFELNFQFIESGDATFPASTANTGAATDVAAGAADSAAASDFAAAVTPLLPLGGLTIQQTLGAVGAWAGQITGLAADASSLMNLASGLTGPYGRFFNGANAGAFADLPSTLLGSTTIETLAIAAAGARATVAAAVASESTLAGELGLPNASPADMATQAQAATAALASTAANPADAIRTLATLAAYSDGAATAIGSALDDLHHRAAVVAMARASALYQPTSYNDAAAVRTLVAGALDTEITVAGDEGDDASFNALRALRVAVVQDLTARGATLAPMIEVDTPSPLPALALAQRLYRDGGRSDQLVAEADPIHPLFMPTQFYALAA
jgi:prophage DNA circulation protein